MLLALKRLRGWGMLCLGALVSAQLLASSGPEVGLEPAPSPQRLENSAKVTLSCVKAHARNARDTQPDRDLLGKLVKASWRARGEPTTILSASKR